VVPGAHVWVLSLPLPHVSSQAAFPAPHVSEHEVLPEQSSEQPPLGQSTVQALLPWQVVLPDSPSVTVQLLVPPQSTMELSPALSVQSLPPAHVEVQLEPQEPLHADCPAHVVVQPVPQSTEHEFFELQSNATLSGGAGAPPAPAAPEAPAAPAAPAVPAEPPAPPDFGAPNEQVPPALQVQVVPLQLQSPVQAGEVVPVFVVSAESADPELQPATSSASEAERIRRFMVELVPATAFHPSRG
jgi:hypothetical protein